MWFVLLIANVLLAYMAGIILGKITSYRKTFCGIYIAVQVAVLVAFKYQLVGISITSLGISFYSLMCMAYVIDVYRGKYVAQKNVFKLIATIGFFPLVLQGPICRYDELEKEMFVKKTFDFQSFTYGITRFFYGLMKKLVIADRLAIVFENTSIVSDSGALVALNMLVYAFYLYTNFSAGIDMVIGIGRVLGVKLPENFNNPFFAVSISDYWRRWHMSLGTWLRDYVFYPVSFSGPVVKASKHFRKKGSLKLAKKIPVYAATIIVWLVTGLWHGVSPNFIIWGMLNAVIILISFELEPLYKKFNDRFEFTKSKVYNVFRIVRTFVLMSVLRALDYNTVTGYFKALKLMVTDFNTNDILAIDYGIEVHDFVIVLVGILIMFIMALVMQRTDYKKLIFDRGVVLSYSIIAAMVAVTIIFGMYGIGYEAKEFIYIRY